MQGRLELAGMLHALAVKPENLREIFAAAIFTKIKMLLCFVAVSVFAGYAQKS